MPSRIILLTGDVEAQHLSALLRGHAPRLAVDAVTSPGALALATAEIGPGTRLVSFLSDVVVPGYVLDQLAGPAYNFHPGPPEFPGSFVAGFAIYAGATDFGVTLHEMAERVDAGPIVDVRRFAVPENAKFLDLEKLSYAAVLEMFADYAKYLATDDRPLTHNGAQWSERMCTRAEADRLSAIEADLSEEEIVRRYRAFG